MIEQCCESILKQLPTLQKQRECPQEAMEPMSTLLFAAARFSDLPELCDLRHIFTERYGSHMESSVKAEFVEKLQKKSFSQEKKLQLMKDIAQEFSVTWDSNAFEHKLSNLSAPKYDQPKNGMRHHSASQKPSTRLPNGVEEEISSKGKYEHAPVSVWKQEVRKEPKDVHVVTTIKDGFSHVPMERTRNAIADEPENREPDFSNAALPSYTKPRRTQNGTYNHDQLKDGLAHKWTGKGQKALDTIGSDEQAFGMKRSSSGKAVNMAPPYTKSHGEKNNNGLIYDQLQRVEEDHTGRERQPVRPVNNDRLINMRPPYVKLKVNDPSSDPDQVIQDSKITDHDRYDGSEDMKGGVFVGEKSRQKPVSVRRKVAKPTVIYTIDSTIDEEKIMIQTGGGRGSDTGRRTTAAYEVTGDVNNKKIMARRPGPPVDDEMDNAIDYGKLLRRTPSGQRRHGSRRSAVVNDGCGDEEEMMMDKLLIHYSRKGTASEASKIRIRSKAIPVDHVEHEIKDKIRPGSRDSVHVPDRSSSLPPELTKPEAGVKMHTRTASMQPDMLSPNGGRVHPRLPNYHDLAAQFNALRRS
nr:uncharacterized protein LOC105052821 isoform X2 [Elaeis guineensis]